MASNSFSVPELTPDAAEALVASFAGKRVLVVGDVMLDEYLMGDVKRISPEAPVPVVDITHCAHVPGGAANVAANIAGLGGTPLLIGVVGDDENAAWLKAELQGKSVETSTLIVASNRPTITKTRIVSGQQQIVRLDREPKGAIGERVLNNVHRRFKELITSADACILSDYAKGLLLAPLCQKLVAAGCESGKPIVVDPKGGDFVKYAGCAVITPNLREAEIASGLPGDTEADLDQIAQRLRDVLGRESALLITRGADGMTLFREGAQAMHVPALAHEVFDVTGAGDTVGGALALALASGASLGPAMMLSNLAASVVVGKSGTATATADELLRAHKETLVQLRKPARSYSSILRTDTRNG